jgi:hypothetical protein
MELGGVSLNGTIWIETIVAIFFAAGGGLTGFWFSRKRSPHWMIGYAVSFALLLAWLAGAHFPQSSTTSSRRWKSTTGPSWWAPP